MNDKNLEYDNKLMDLINWIEKFYLSEKEFTASLSKKTENYKQTSPHVVAAEKLMLHGQKVTSGTIIRYVITKGHEPISKRAQPIEYMEGKQYDPEYYIQNQVLPATLRILEALGYSEEQIMSNEKQTSLDSFF